MRIINRLNFSHGLKNLVFISCLFASGSIQFAQSQDLDKLLPQTVPKQVVVPDEQLTQVIDRVADLGATAKRL